MFGKSNWAMCALDPGGHSKFVELMESYDETLRPLDVLRRLKEEGGTGTALAPFYLPFGDDTNTLEGCDILDQVYAIWFTQMAEAPTMDVNVLKEHLSFTSYSSPFKFLPKEQKQDIMDMIENEERTIGQIHAPVILDFKQGRLWVSSTKKDILEAVRVFLAQNEIDTSALCFDFGTNDWPSQVLNFIVEGQFYLDDFLNRAEQVKKEGDPKLVEAHENPVMEKILKRFFRCNEYDGYKLFLGTPSKLNFSNQITTVGVNNPYDGNEILNNGPLGVASARVTISEGDTELMQDLISVEISDNTHIDPGFIVFKGLEAHDLSSAIKETGKANGKLTLKDYWACDYERNQVAVARICILICGILGIGSDYGIKRVATKDSVSEDED